MSGVRWVVLAILFCTSSVAYILRLSFNIVGPTMMHDLGMNEYQLGMAFSAFAISYALFQIPAGMFGDKFGARFTISAAAVLWALLTVATALVPGTDVMSVTAIVTILVITRVLVGISHAPLYPVTIGGTVANWFPVRQWGLPNGLSSTGVTLGGAASATIIGWLMEPYGWRGALLMIAPAGLLIAVAYYWFITDDPKDHRLMTKAELDYIRSDRPKTDAAPDHGAWKKLLKNRNVLLITFSYFCMNYIFYLFFNWFFFYLVEVKNFSAGQAGVLTAALWILGAIGATTGGFVCDMLVRWLGIGHGPRIQVMTGLLLSAVFLFFGATSENATLAVVLLCICFGWNQLTEAPYWVSTMAVSGKHAAVATGVLNTGGNLTGFVGGMLVPAIAGLLSWPAAINTGGVFAIIGAVTWLFIKVEQVDD